MPVPLLATRQIPEFPAVSLALSSPNGLLAAGGNLSPKWLLSAYRQGIFPWYNEGEPILWWSPNPRCVLWPENLHVSRSLAKSIRNKGIHITRNTAFQAVIAACADWRPGTHGTWIDLDMQAAYIKLHQQGFAHSYEAWHQHRLVGGLYGVQLGSVFFGESMFSRSPDASKIAFTQLCSQSDIRLIDCQLESQHLLSLGATCIAREKFIALLDKLC